MFFLELKVTLLQDSQLFLPLLLCFVALYVARRVGFFKVKEKGGRGTLSLLQLFGAFLIYFGVIFLLFPLLLVITGVILYGSATGGISLYRSLSSSSLIVIQLIAFLAVFLDLCFYLFINKKLAKLVLWGNQPNEILKNIKFGALSLLIAYPFVLLSNNAITFFAEKFIGKHVVEQTVLKQLKNLMAIPSLFIFAALMVVLIIPFIEELCFRGFLQRYLRQKLGMKSAIFLSSLIFALLHFSKSQGAGNIELIPSLFVLSCFLGFLYERQQNLFASFALHALFNGITVIALVLS